MSVHIVKLGRNRIVAASDSRGSTESGPVDGVYRKLFQAGERSLCGIVGLVGLSQEDRTFHGAETVMGELCATESLRDSPRAFIDAVRNAFYPGLVALFADDSSQFEWLLADTKIMFAAFLLKRARGGVIDLIELQIPLNNVDGKPAVGEPVVIPHLENYQPWGPFAYSLGPERWRNNPLPGLDPDKSDRQILEAIDGIVGSARQAEIKIAGECGEITHVAAIEEGGVRWFRNQ